MTCKRHADKLADDFLTTGRVLNTHAKKPRSAPPPALPIADAVGLLPSELQDPAAAEATIEPVEPAQRRRRGKGQPCTIQQKLEVLSFIARCQDGGMKNPVMEAMIAYPERLGHKSQVTQWRRAARHQSWELLPPHVQRRFKECPNYLRKRSGAQFEHLRHVYKHDVM